MTKKKSLGRSKNLDSSYNVAINEFLAKNQTPTINDVATICGVSKKTVSRIINNSENVKLETKEFVQEIIAKIGFRPNIQARALAQGKSFLVGLIYDNPNAQYVVNMQMGVLDALRGTGFELVVHPCIRNSPTLFDEIEEFVVMQKLSGVIILPPIAEDRRFGELFARLDLPYIRITARDGRHSVPPISSAQIVSLDGIGCEAASRHIAQLGHRRIGYIGGNIIYPSAHERRAGFDRGLAQYGAEIPKDLDEPGDYSFESGYKAGLRLLSNPNPPTAIIACNDEMAAGVYKAAYERGFRIPHDISIVGFDDSPLASRLSPDLTSVRLPTRIMGTIAGRAIISRTDISNFTEFFDSSLVIRGSTTAI